jgi:pimeloyl-ACP methyl ester carboxylesterase
MIHTGQQMKTSKQTFWWMIVAWIPVCFLSIGCNVVQLKKRSIERGLEKAGLTMHREPIGDAMVEYWEGGKGTAVVLLHGFGAEAIWQWDKQIKALVEYHRVIVPNLLWFGGVVSIEPDYSIEHQVRMLLGLLEKLGEKQAAWVGVSYGGLVAFELANTHPDRVSKLVVVDSPGRVYTRADYEAFCERFKVKDIGELLIPKDRNGVRKLLEIAYFDPPYTPGFALDQTLQEMYSSHNEEKIALLHSILNRIDDPQEIGSSTETLIIWGREDLLFPLEIGERLRERLGDRAHIVVIDKARHAPNMEYPDLFNRHLLKFLD